MANPVAFVLFQTGTSNNGSKIGVDDETDLRCSEAFPVSGSVGTILDFPVYRY